MIENPDRALAPLLPGLVEGSDELSALGIDADHREVRLQVPSDLLVDVSELLVPEIAVGWFPEARLDALHVPPERDAHRVE